MHLYEVRQRTDKPGVDLMSDVLPFGRLWYSEPSAVATLSDTRSTAIDHVTL